MKLFDITNRRELLQVLQEGHNVVASAGIPGVNVNMLMVRLLTMNQYGYEFALPFSKGRIYGNDQRDTIFDHGGDRNNDDESGIVL